MSMNIGDLTIANLCIGSQQVLSACLGTDVVWPTEIPAGLPSKPFLFNYNAKRYVPLTATIGMEQGQLFNHDITLDGSRVDAYPDYLYFTGVTPFRQCYNSYLDNPFNRTSADCQFTFIYKTKDYQNAGNNKLFANRKVMSDGQSKYDCHNYLIASNDVYGFDGSFAPTNNPQYVVIRAFPDNSGLRQEVDASGNTIQSAATASVAWDDPSAGFAFFGGGCNYNGSNESFKSKFYWMYCANQTLTDAEVLQVIRYNENM